MIKYSPIFKNCQCYRKIFKDKKHSSLHLAQKYAQIFVLGHYMYLSLEVHSFPQATLAENCQFFGTDNVCGGKSKHVFVQNVRYGLFIHSRYSPFCNILDDFVYYHSWSIWLEKFKACSCFKWARCYICFREHISWVSTYTWLVFVAGIMLTLIG